MGCSISGQRVIWSVKFGKKLWDNPLQRVIWTAAQVKKWGPFVVRPDDDGLTALDMVGKLVKNLSKEEKNICIQILKDAIAAAT